VMSPLVAARSGSNRAASYAASWRGVNTRQQEGKEGTQPADSRR
jgi:hypothetical protein